MKIQLKKFEEPISKFLFILCVFATLIFISTQVFATDLLAGTDKDMKDTMRGTGRTWLILIDVCGIAFAFISKKNPAILFTIIALLIFINAGLLLAGG